ncbi:MAG TPA: anti-sigma factor [Acidimicrobiales bacterium]|nr:anti-sigma factor [Acidimicrobiales bacterium]
MTHEEIQELLGAYALDAVDPDEASEIELHLRDCPRCRAEVAEHRETAAFLAHAGADAPADLWDRIAGTIDVPAPVIPMALRLGDRARDRRGGSWSRPVALVGVAAAMVIAVLGLQVRNQDQRIDELAAELAASDGGFAAAVSHRDAEMLELEGATAIPVVVSEGKAWLQAAALPELEEGRTYQLWGAAGDELVSIAVLGRDPGVISFDVEGYALLAITEEDAPGVVKSANPPVVAGELS